MFWLEAKSLALSLLRLTQIVGKTYTINDEDRIPLITSILQFMESPWDDKIDIQTVGQI